MHRRPDQSAPATVSPTGVGYEGPEQGRDRRAQAGDILTTAQGVWIPDTDHSSEVARRVGRRRRGARGRRQRPGGAGVLTDDSAHASLAAGLLGALGLHRAWDRTPLVTNNAVPPAP